MKKRQKRKEGEKKRESVINIFDDVFRRVVSKKSDLTGEYMAPKKPASHRAAARNQADREINKIRHASLESTLTTSTDSGRGRMAVTSAGESHPVRMPIVTMRAVNGRGLR